MFKNDFLVDYAADVDIFLSLFDFDGDRRDEAILRIDEHDKHVGEPEIVKIFSITNEGAKSYAPAADFYAAVDGTSMHQAK